jgi:type IV pilus assembly protein PilB|tara:strand:- start:279 stop:1751 length:1473 start_codon:yes stop_codon:yes gene_type:complete
MAEGTGAERDDGTLVTMDQAVKQLSTTRATFYRWLRAGRIKGFKMGRQWRFRQDDIDHFLDGGSPKIGLTVTPKPLIDALAAYAKLDVNDEPSIESAANCLTVAAIKCGARHFHVDLLGTDEGNRGTIRFRIDGLIEQICSYDVRLHQPLIDQLKHLAGLDVTESSKPQTGRFLFAISPTKKIQITTSVVPSVLGECLTGQFLDPAATRMDLDLLGLAGNNLQRVHSALAENKGLLLASGPSDSGKLVTAYSMLHHIDTSQLKLATVEGPVEVPLPNAIQLNVDESRGLGYPVLIRSALATQPDVVLVKFIGNAETLVEALDAALSKLVICTMHCRDVVSGLITMNDWGARGLLLGEAITLLTSQRLARRLCPDCKQPSELTDDDRVLIDRVCRAHGTDGLQAMEFASPNGCDKCHGSGFRGRFGIYESLQMNSGIESALMDGVGQKDLRRVAIGSGMDTLCLDGLRQAAAGITSIREVRRIAGDLLNEY